MFSERIMTSDESIKIGKRFFNSNNIGYNIIKYGDSIKSHTVELSYHDVNDLKILGNGKGLGSQSLASAIFESIEHYLLDVTYFDEKLFKKLEFNDLKKYPSLLSHYALNKLINDYNNNTIKCIRFNCIDRNEEYIYYPKFLMFPNYPIDSEIPLKYSIYSTNNGMAIGASEEEALLHGFLEIVERDALSLHFIKYFLLGKEQKLYIVKKDDINKSNKNILKELNKYFDKILIINITSSNQIPSVLVIGYNNKYKYPFVGSGSSLSKNYAIERALTEALQEFHLYGDDIFMENILIEENLKRIPNLRNIIYYNYDHIDTQEKSLNDFGVDTINISSQLKLLSNLIKKDGGKLYYNTLFQSQGIYFSKCVIPTYEQFHLIRSGQIVMPSERGMRYIKE